VEADMEDETAEEAVSKVEDEEVDAIFWRIKEQVQENHQLKK
jgi:hypothetical protein